MRHWYNNSKIEILINNYLEIPKGFIKGRLPVSDETRLKHSKNNGMHKLTHELRIKRQIKISNTKNNKSEQEKLQYSLNVSKGRKGKGLHNIPWNKGKTGLLKAWNKGLKYKLSDTSKKLMVYKRFHTQKLNGTLGINQDTSIEVNYYNYLCSIYNEDDILHPYIDKDRYPFKCDFYIKSEDKFIEIHGTWTHGGKPYDPNDIECIKQLESWKQKAKFSKFYQNAIYTWTDLDVRKLEAAKKNSLNFEVIYFKK